MVLAAQIFTCDLRSEPIEFVVHRPDLCRNAVRYQPAEPVEVGPAKWIEAGYGGDRTGHARHFRPRFGAPHRPQGEVALMTARSLPIVLSVIAGATDVIGVLGLNGLFTAHITGNLVLLAARIVAGLPASISYILSVPVFMLVLFIARVIARAVEGIGGSSLQPLLLLQLLALVAFLLLRVTTGPWRDPDTAFAITAGMCGVSAMAVQNALVQISLKNTPSTAAMTTNITRLTLDIAEVLVGSDVQRAKNRVRNTLPVVIGFVVGCSLGGAFEAAVGLWSLILPTALAFVACVISMGSSRELSEARQ